jgi:ABC-type amino acid transport substrate-binding protein
VALVKAAAAVAVVALLSLPSALAQTAAKAPPAKPAPAAAKPAGPADPSPGELVVGLHLPDPGFQVGAVAGDRITFVAGLEADLARAIADRLRLGAPSFVQIGLDSVTKPGAKKWEIALARLSPTTGGPVAWSGPYLKAGPVVLARKRLPQPTILADLARDQVCTTVGSKGRGIIAARIRPQVAPLVAKDDNQLVGWIRTGRCDAAIREAPELAASLDGRLDSIGQVIGIVDTGRSYAVAVPRASGLQPRVDRAVTFLRGNGTVHALAMKWLGFDPNRLPALP